MGFFADIIRDSRRGGVASPAPEAPLSRGGEEMSTDAPVATEAVPVVPAVPAGDDPSVIRLREEGNGQPLSVGQRPVQIGAVTRQVVDPSPSEHTPVAGLPEVTAKGLALPNTVTREQAGCESARTVTDDFHVEQMESIHDGGSIDVPLVSVVASDSFVRESSSGDMASRAGKVSVETQGRQQAGVTRAGSTTPPEQRAGEAVEHFLMQPHAEPVTSDPRKAAAEVMPVPFAPHDSLSRTRRAGHSPEPGMVSEEGAGTASPPGRESFVKETRHEHLSDAKPTVTTREPAEAQEREQPLPLRAGDGQGISRRFPPPPEPQVRIGTIEIVVVTPAPAVHPSRSEEQSRPDLASRHYLRNF